MHGAYRRLWALNLEAPPLMHCRFIVHIAAEMTHSEIKLLRSTVPGIIDKKSYHGPYECREIVNVISVKYLVHEFYESDHSC
jgi:hypothetical protein